MWAKAPSRGRPMLIIVKAGACRHTLLSIIVYRRRYAKSLSILKTKIAQQQISRRHLSKAAAR